MANDHNEKAHAKGEHVYFVSFVSVVELLLVVTLASESLDGIFDFRCFVPSGSNIFCQLCHFVSVVRAQFRACCEAEVGNFDIELLVNEQILQLQVPMCNALSMAVVDAFKYLSEAESRHLLGKRTIFGNQIEQISMLGQFKCNVAYFS